MPTLRAGDLRERIMFLTPTRVGDHGFASITWAIAFTAWAKANIRGGVNEQTQDRGELKLAVDFDVRYRSDITGDMKVIWRGITFEISDALQLVPIEGRMMVPCLQDSVSLSVNEVPGNPADLVAAFNALGGGTTGGTFAGLYIVAINQTIVVDGTSSTGFRCTFWDDAQNPGQGRHFRPDPALNSGAGAECLADGSIKSKGLHIPSANSAALTVATRRDPTTATAPYQLAGSGVLPLHSWFSDRGAGITVGQIGALKQNTNSVKIGEDGVGGPFLDGSAATDFIGWNQNTTYNYGTDLIHQCIYDVFNTTVGRYAWTTFGRDLAWWQSFFNTAGPYSTFDNTIAGAQRVRLMVDGGATATQPIKVVYFLQGRADSAQRKLLCDYFASQYLIVEDTRRLAMFIGDSFQEGLSFADWAAIQGGSDGAAAIPNYCTTNFARSGAAIDNYQIAHLFVAVQDGDFSKRPALGAAVMGGEYLNGGQRDQNEYLFDQCRAAGMRTALYNILANTYVNFSNIATWNAGILGDPPTHGDVSVDFLGLPWSTFNWGDGHDSTEGGHAYPTGQNPVFWGGNHPTTLMNRYWRRFYAGLCMAAIGDDDSTRTMYVVPSVDHVGLTAGAPTATPTSIAKNRIGTTLGGKTFAYTSGDVSIATVNSSTGLITRVAVGHTYRLGISNDGGIEVVDVNCT